MNRLRYILFFTLLIGFGIVTAQNSSVILKEDSIKIKPVKAVLDTEESLKYIGNQLLFQVKKRLNLTSKEEEKKQSKSATNKKFSFFGIEVERD